MLLPKTKRFKDRDYRHSFKDRTCLIDDIDCFGDVVGAHTRMGWGSQEKPHDYWNLPLCFFHHQQQHQHGEVLWWQTLFMEDPIVLGRVLRMAGQFLYVCRDPSFEEWIRDRC